MKSGIVMAVARSLPYGLSVGWTNGIQESVWRHRLSALQVDCVRGSIAGDSVGTQVSTFFSSVVSAGATVMPTITYFNSGNYGTANIYGLSGYPGGTSAIQEQNRSFVASWMQSHGHLIGDYVVLSNERDSYALQSGNGASASNYGTAKADEAYAEIYGAYLGMKDVYPNKIGVVNISWAMRTGFWDYLHNKGFTDFVCSTHQYYEPLTNLANGSSAFVNQLEVLKTYRKPSLNNGKLMCTEINRLHGSGYDSGGGTYLNGQYAEEASYLDAQLDQIYRSNVFSHCFVYELYDLNTNTSSQNQRWYGLINSLNPSGNTWTEGVVKPAFGVCQRRFALWKKTQGELNPKLG